MKKKLFCMILALVLCAALCACGTMREDRGTQNNDMDILPDVSPMISPDVDDGIVTDGDGTIGNGSHGADSSASPSAMPGTAGNTGSTGSTGNTGSMGNSGNSGNGNDIQPSSSPNP